MKILSIDTSSKFCSVSLFLSEKGEESLDSTKAFSHSSELAVNTKRLLDKNNILIKSLDYIAVNIGPGSFTGLRIGISFVKGLCFSNNIPLIPIKSFDIIKSKISPIDNQFYICVYSHKHYAYAQKYYKDNKSLCSPKLINLNNKIDIPIYISGLLDVYDNNIKNIDITSLDLLKIARESHCHSTNDLY